MFKKWKAKRTKGGRAPNLTPSFEVGFDSGSTISSSPQIGSHTRVDPSDSNSSSVDSRSAPADINATLTGDALPLNYHLSSTEDSISSESD